MCRPDYPKQRLAFMLEDSQVPVLLTQEKFKETLPYHQAKVICLDADWAAIAQERADNPIAAPRLTTAMLSTPLVPQGTPKGAMNTQAGYAIACCGCRMPTN